MVSLGVRDAGLPQHRQRRLVGDEVGHGLHADPLRDVHDRLQHELVGAAVGKRGDQAEYRGLVQYYRLADTLHTLSMLTHVMEVAMVRTLANKYRTTCTKISQRYGATMHTDDGPYKGIHVMVTRQPPKKSLTASFGGLS